MAGDFRLLGKDGSDGGDCVTEERNLKRRRWRKRLGRCYELAYLTQQDNPDWTLVHGEVDDGHGRVIGHAWIEKDDEVYDAVLDCVFLKALYKLERWAVAFEKYTRTEAALLLVKTKNMGPWTPDETASVLGIPVSEPSAES
jgi:hypothetical protein